MFKNMGGNIPGGNFTGGSFPDTILLYLLFNKKSDEKIVKKKEIFNLKTFKRKREICSCTNGSL